MIRALNIFAAIWACLAALAIVLGYVGIWMKSGFTGLRQVMNPFNPWNYLAIVIAFLPAIGARMLAQRLKKRGRASR